MITVEQALTWLNFNGTTHLSHQTKYNLWELKNTSLPDDEKDRLIECLIARTHAHPPSLEHAEVLLECGNIQKDRGRAAEALEYFTRAFKIYQLRGDNLRSATALWMMSLLEWANLNHSDAYAHAYSARAMMKKLTFSPTALLHPTILQWFQDRLEEMNLDLIITPEEGYEWITQFEPSRMQPAAQQTRLAVNEHMRFGRFEQANCLLLNMQKMARSGPDRVEESEVLAFIGLIRNQMGDVKEAYRLFRQSMMHFQPRKHQYAVLTWVLGLLQFKLHSEGGRAITSFNAAIDMMEQLKLNARQANKMIEHDWYVEHLDLMRKALQIKVAELSQRTG